MVKSPLLFANLHNSPGREKLECIVAASTNQLKINYFAAGHRKSQTRDFLISASKLNPFSLCHAERREKNFQLLFLK